MSSQQHQTLSVADYLKITDLSNLVNNSVNSCAAVRPHPSLVPAFLSQHFHKQHFESPAAVAIHSINLSVCGLDGTGTPQVQLTLALMDGRSASALVSHSCGIAAVHPSTSRTNRRAAFIDVRQRGQRAKAVSELFANTNNNGGSSSSRNLIQILCNAVCGSCSFPNNNSNNSSSSITGIGGGSGADKSAISAAKPLRDFDLILSTADGSTNFTVLSSNIATAASIAFCKLRSQIHRTPLGLNQPLYKLLRRDFAFLENNSISNSGQLVVDSNNSIKSTTTSFSENNKKRQQVGGSSASSSSSYTLPLPIVPLFSGSDAPVFGKLRILKQVVIFPNPKVIFNNNNSISSQQQQQQQVTKMLSEIQQVVNVCFEKLTSDETTQQPPIMLPHQGGTIKHVALESFSAVVEFAEECIREALPQYFPQSVLAAGQQAMNEKEGGGGGGRGGAGSNKSNNNNASSANKSSIGNPNSADENNNLVDVHGNPLLQPSYSSLLPEHSPMLVGLILDGSLCSMRGNDSDQFAFGSNNANENASSNNNTNQSPGKKGSSSTTRNPSSPQSKQHQQNQQNNQNNNNNTKPGDEPLHSSQPPPKYTVIDGTPDWTAAQLSDHLAALCATKPILKYIQDSHREDQGGPSGEWMNDSWRRITARCCGPERVVNVDLATKRDAPPTDPSELTQNVNNDICIAGDELFCSNQAVIERLAPETVCNTVVVRLNDAGTVTNAMNCSRCFTSIVNNGSVCVSPELCDNESASSGFVVDFAFAIGARFLNINSSLVSSAGCQGASLLTRYHQIANDIIIANGNNNMNSLNIPSDLPDYSRVRNYASEPVEPLGPLEVPNAKDVKKRR